MTTEPHPYPGPLSSCSFPSDSPRVCPSVHPVNRALSAHCFRFFPGKLGAGSLGRWHFFQVRRWLCLGLIRFHNSCQYMIAKEAGKYSLQLDSHVLGSRGPQHTVPSEFRVLLRDVENGIGDARSWRQFYREMIAIPTAGAGPGTEHSLLFLAPDSGVPALPGWGSMRASTSISESLAQPSCSCLQAFALLSLLCSPLSSLTLLRSHSDPSPRHPHNRLYLDGKPTAPSPSVVLGLRTSARVAPRLLLVAIP